MRTFAIPSETQAGVMYRVHYANGVAVCNCRGALSHGNCKHQRKVEAQMADEEQEVTTAVATRDSVPPAIVVDSPGTGLLPRREDMQMMTDIARTVIHAKGMVPQNIETPHQALAIMLAGHELGLRPMTSLRHVFIVNGKTEIETRAMVGIIKARDPNIEFSWPEYTPEAVTCVLKRPGQPEVKVRYTLDDARVSGQLEGRTGIWKKYPRDMLYAAATKRACRLGAPDIINAIDSGLQHTVREAEVVEAQRGDFLAAPAPTTATSADVPAAPPAAPPATVVDDEPAEVAIPPEAYNEGDADVPLSPELPLEEEVPVPATPLVLLQRWLDDAREQLTAGQFGAIVDGVNQAYPGALTKRGDTVLGGPARLTDAQAKRVLKGLKDVAAGAK